MKKVDLGLKPKCKNYERTPNDFYNENIFKGFLCIAIAFILMFLCDLIVCYADEYDSKEVAEIMVETGAYDIIQENKEEYPYYLFLDYSLFDTVQGIQIPTLEKHRNYELVLFSEPFQNGVYPPSYVGGEPNYNTHVGMLVKEGKRKEYSYQGDNQWNCTNDGVVVSHWSACLDVLIGSNLNIFNEDGSFFFGLTSPSPILTVSTIKRTLLKHMVYLIGLATGLIILLTSFRKGWTMLKTSLVRV